MDLSAEQEGLDTTGDTTTQPAELTNGHDATSSEHQFQKAISAWRSIGLTGLIPELDTTASEIVENQKDTLVQRKDLAQKTKDYRKLDDQAKLAEWKTLLKSYQTFIDLLTTHGKTTSTAFLQLYSTISDAPDPYPLLEASVDSLLVSEDTVPKLHAENEHLQRTVRNLTRDLELAESQLQHEKIARKELEETQQAGSEKVEASWQAVLSEKKNNWDAKEKAYEEKLENQERLFNELKASYEVAQRLGPNAIESASQVTASAAELEMLSSDLERTSQRLAEVEGRNEQLRTELAQTTSNMPKRVNVEDEPAFTRLRTENSSLIRKVDAVKLEKDSQIAKIDTKLKSLERDLRLARQEREELQTKLLRWQDYPELKRELDVFKAVELSAMEDDNAESGVTANEIGEPPKNSLEQMLLARNKKLSSEMAILRVSHQELRQEMDNLQETLSKTNADLERAQNLNATLENDLVELQQEASNAFPMSAKSVSSRYPTSATVARSPYAPSSITPRRASPTSSIISGFDPNHRSTFGESLESLRAGDAVGGGSGILPMVQAQRDRFKQKSSQLEAELQKQYNKVSSLRQEIAALQKDNLNLYEKTRYASTYQRNPNASSALAYSANPGNSVQISSDTVDRYKSAYEANISPFAQFRGREAARAYKRMSMPERMIYSVTRLVLANRVSRNLFAIYCIGLHLLVFVMLYWMQTADIEKHATHLGHAASVAGGSIAAAHHGDWHEEGLNSE